MHRALISALSVCCLGLQAAAFSPSPSSIPHLHAFTLTKSLSSIQRRPSLLFAQTTDDSLSSNGSQTLSVQEAEALKKRAKELLAEARAMEAELSYSRSSKARDLDKEQDALIEKLFGNDEISISNHTNTAGAVLLANKLRDERWSPEKLLPILERLYRRLRRAMGKSPASGKSQPSGAFQIGDTRQGAGEEDKQETLRLSFYLADLLGAAQLLDEEFAKGKNPNTRWNERVATMLEARLRELQRGLEVAKGTGNGTAIQGYVDQSLSLTTAASGGGGQGNPAFLEAPPRWLPPTFGFYLNDPKAPVEGKIDPVDVGKIRNAVLGDSKFVCTSIESNSLSASFGGSFRGWKEDSPLNYTSLAFTEIQDRLYQTGLSERVQVFLIRDPRRFVNGAQRLAILAVPKAMSPAVAEGYSMSSVVACVAAFTTTLAYSVSCFALNLNFFETVMNQPQLNPFALLACVPLVFGVFGIQAVHEVAHRMVAKWRKVELGLPVPLPSPAVGTFGATTPFKTFPADQETVFDVAVSGPLAGMVASIGCLVAGTFATLNAPLELLSTFPTVPVAFFKGSFLTGSILSTLAPKLMLLPTAQPIPVHPALCIGFAGLLTNALNMLPILGLDGGNALSAIVGRSRAFLASAGTIFTLSLSFFQNDSSTSLFASFGIIYAISRMGRKPLLVRDEISPVSEVRISIYLAAFILSLLALTPYPGGQGII